MTTSLAPRTSGLDAAPPSTVAPIPFGRLVRVEWAKATDTRASRWLLAIVALWTVGMVAVPVVAPSTFEQTQATYLRVAALGLTVLLPVVAILVFTSEWSQRSAMTTFTQEPRRLRVLRAKLAVSTLLGVGGAAFAAVVAVPGMGAAAASGRTLAADLSVGVIAGYVLFILLSTLGGAALGAVLQSSGVAIAASFVLPAILAVLGEASTLVAEWLDMSVWGWVLENDWGGHVPQIVFSIVLWVAAPLAAGALRTLHRDVG